jgi:hypothetical protein
MLKTAPAATDPTPRPYSSGPLRTSGSAVAVVLRQSVLQELRHDLAVPGRDAPTRCRRCSGCGRCMLRPPVPVCLAQATDRRCAPAPSRAAGPPALPLETPVSRAGPWSPLGSLPPSWRPADVPARGESRGGYHITPDNEPITTAVIVL